MIKTLSVGNIIANDSSDCITIVTSSNGLETFLSSCIPYLQFNVIFANRYGLGSELDANSDLVLISIALVSVLKK